MKYNKNKDFNRFKSYTDGSLINQNNENCEIPAAFTDYCDRKLTKLLKDSHPLYLMIAAMIAIFTGSQNIINKFIT